MSKTLAWITKSSNPKHRLEAIEDYITNADTIGLDVPDAVRDRAGIARNMENLAVSQGPNFEATQRRLADEVLQGVTPIEAAVDQVVEAHRLNARGSAGAEFVQAVARQAALAAWYALVSTAPDHWSRIFPTAHDKIISRVVKAGAQIVGIRTVDDAVRARKGDAWAAAEEAYRDWQTLHSIAEGFRAAGLDTSAPNRRGRPEDVLSKLEDGELRFREYEKTRQYRRGDFTNPGQWLYAVAQECEPAVLTIAEALEYQHRDARRAREAKEAATPTRHRDSSSGYTMPREVMDQIVREAEAAAS